jgi:tetrahydromethanopterin S-methyltransferase subunit B
MNVSVNPNMNRVSSPHLGNETKATRETEIAVAMQALRTAHQQLDGMVDILEMKLAPVLQPLGDDPRKPVETIARSSSSPLGLALDEETNAVMSISRRIATIAGHCAV